MQCGLASYYSTSQVFNSSSSLVEGACHHETGRGCGSYRASGVKELHTQS
jgi:hypothetical protein